MDTFVTFKKLIEKRSLPIFHRPWPPLAIWPVGNSEQKRFTGISGTSHPDSESDAVRSAANLVIRTLTKITSHQSLGG